MAQTLAERMKSYELYDTGRIIYPGQPLFCRLDGRGFHEYTRGLKRPYDERLSTLMVDTAVELVKHFGANVGYVQSDEITLAWYLPALTNSQYPFGGRIQKLDSLLAAHASVFFFSEVHTRIPEKAGKRVAFDCRTFAPPDLSEAQLAFVWRQLDAKRNAVSMAAHSMFSHKSLLCKNRDEMIARMKDEKGVEFSDYPDFFRLGTFVTREKALLPVDDALREKLMAKNVPIPEGPIERSLIKTSSFELTRDSLHLLHL